MATNHGQRANYDYHNYLLTFYLAVNRVYSEGRGTLSRGGVRGREIIVNWLYNKGCIKSIQHDLKPSVLFIAWSN
jgi:hypothetical protein